MDLTTVGSPDMSLLSDPRSPGDAVHTAEQALIEAFRSVTVHDLVSGSRYRWSSRNHVRLDPVAGEPAHILRVESD
jgi:hypothetical protein